MHRIFFIILLCFSLTVSTVGATESNHLRLALLPIPDVLPVFVAEELGLFKEAGIEVEVLPVGSGLQRDQLMQAGKVDGMLNELASVASFNRQFKTVQVVATARRPYEGEPLFRLLAGKDTGVSSVEELSDVPVIISKNTVIDYVTERMLQVGGVAEENIVTRSVASLPERYQLLVSGQIEAATLPEPLASSAMVAGSVDVVDDTSIDGLSCSVMTFSLVALQQKEEAVQKFVMAWNKAATALNNNPEKFHTLMLQKIKVPKNVQKTYQIPQYPIAEVPTEDQWTDVMEWMVARGLLQEALPYTDSVITTFQKK